KGEVVAAGRVQIGEDGIETDVAREDKVVLVKGERSGTVHVRRIAVDRDRIHVGQVAKADDLAIGNRAGVDDGDREGREMIDLRGDRPVCQVDPRGNRLPLAGRDV